MNVIPNLLSYILLLHVLVLQNKSENWYNIQADEEKIHWHKNVSLDWNDFLASPNLKSHYSAESSLNISYGMKIKESNGKTTVDFEVNCYFDRSESWVKNEKRTPQLLGHEQIHFDIAEYFARKLRKEFSEHSYTTLNFQTKSESIFAIIYKDYANYQAQYDALTKHGSNHDAQAVWAKKVGELISKSERFEKERWEASSVN